jgi:hypothetical protein
VVIPLIVFLNFFCFKILCDFIVIFLPNAYCFFYIFMSMLEISVWEDHMCIILIVSSVVWVSPEIGKFSASLYLISVLEKWKF